MSTRFIVLFSCLVLAVAAQGPVSNPPNGMPKPAPNGSGPTTTTTTTTNGARPVPAPAATPAPANGSPAPTQPATPSRRSVIGIATPVQPGTPSRRPVIGYPGQPRTPTRRPAPAQPRTPTRRPVITIPAPSTPYRRPVTAVPAPSRRPRSIPEAQVLPGSVHNRHCREAQHCSNKQIVIYATDGKYCHKFITECQLAQANCQHRRRPLKIISRHECHRLPRMSSPY